MNSTLAPLNVSLPTLQWRLRQQLPFNYTNFPLLAISDDINRPKTFLCSNSSTFTVTAPSETEAGDSGEDDGDDAPTSSPAAMIGGVPPLRQRRRRYRKQYPGEQKGITEEMRFVAMRLRNSGKPKKSQKGTKDSGSENESESEIPDYDDDENGGSVSDKEVENDGSGNEETWEPSVEGFINYLVDSQLVFSTIERIVDESDDVSYAYFRKTGLERSDSLSKDLRWFSEAGNVIPEPSPPGVTYASYLEELAEKTPPLFLCHFYNIYFSHVAGGQVITKKVSEKLFEGRELEFCAWEGQEEELLKVVRDNLNMVGEHWSRDEKNKCLRETTKAFRYLGQIVRLIIL
ncbi:OLC1v1016768C2 [Oldenlandia corymbosa var. corymbosa]|uniref:OLC1v1016768C2 n=1 Tax=Oldenlandia corymbosa var. corymbosa TaxID=529605 RepID=A0AAV1E7W5_OLDCO|nr:OLC1v1016768C2 [Oldenlandia corymbosa var. corymbosa]